MSDVPDQNVGFSIVIVDDIFGGKYQLVYFSPESELKPRPA